MIGKRIRDWWKRSRITDNKLRDVIAKHSSNGLYATEICRKCKSFKATSDGDVKTAKIVNECKYCSEEVRDG